MDARELQVSARVDGHPIGGMMRRIEGMFERYFERGAVEGGERVSRGASPRRPRRALVRWDGSRNERLYREAVRRGVSLHEIALEARISQGLLYDWAKRRGLPRTRADFLKHRRKLKKKGFTDDRNR